MANPFLGEQSVHTPTNISDPVGDDYWFGSTNYHVAGFLVIALAIIVFMHVTGFKAMVGIGRG